MTSNPTPSYEKRNRRKILHGIVVVVVVLVVDVVVVLVVEVLVVVVCRPNRLITSSATTLTANQVSSPVARISLSGSKNPLLTATFSGRSSTRNAYGIRNVPRA